MPRNGRMAKGPPAGSIMPLTRLASAPCAGTCEKQSIVFFARKRRDQLFAANLTQKGQIVAGKFPQHIRRNLIVIMSKDVADTRYLLPRNSGLPRFHVVRKMAACFGNDLYAALDQPTLFPVLFKSVERHAVQHAANAFDCLNDVRETWRDNPLDHQNTSTADFSIRVLRRGCRLLRVMMSVLQPRMLAACSFTSISS